MKAIYQGDVSSAQIPGELDWLIGVLTREKVANYLEIGSRHGHSFWNVATRVPTMKRMVSVDLPGSVGGRKDGRAVMTQCVEDIRKRGVDATIIFGDSTDPAIVAQVSKHFPFDAVLIDGNHSLPYLSKDWVNYSPQARLVILHDISWVANGRLSVIDVPEFWKRIKSEFYSEEIRLSKTDCGIGVVWKTPVATEAAFLDDVPHEQFTHPEDLA